MAGQTDRARLVEELTKQTPENDQEQKIMFENLANFLRDVIQYDVGQTIKGPKTKGFSCVLGAFIVKGTPYKSIIESEFVLHDNHQLRYVLTNDKNLQRRMPLSSSRFFEAKQRVVMIPAVVSPVSRPGSL